MKIFQSKNINDYKLILEGLVAEWGHIYWSEILKWCNIIDENPEDINKYCQIWIIECDGRNVGICGLWSQKENSLEELWLGWFGLIPEMRNKKIGNDILKWMEETGKELGCKKILLSCEDKDIDGKALKFYIRNGYKRISSVDEYLHTHPQAKEGDFEDKQNHTLCKLLTN